MTSGAPTEIVFILLVFGLFVVPKFLQRARVPSAVTSVLLGVIAGIFFPPFVDDATISQFATLGIVALFLFAGLEVDLEELRQQGAVIVQHLGIQVAVLLLVALALMPLLDSTLRLAVLVSLALVTPSTGFILDSLHSFGLSADERFWVKAKAISTELVALTVLFVVLQSETATRLSLSFLTLAGLVLVVPLAFRFFALAIRPYAPKSEFAFVVIVALVCAYVTRRLGVYYLVGAFLVGVAARQFRRDLPSMASEKMLHAVELFASFFVPFYFFRAGLHLSIDDLTAPALLAAGASIVIVAPLRTLVVAGHRKVALNEDWHGALRVSTPLLPTLVFTLVIAEIIRERFPAAPAWLFGALVLYTIGNTLIPGFVLHAPVAEPDLIVLSSAEDEAPPTPARPDAAR